MGDNASIKQDRVMVLCYCSSSSFRINKIHPITVALCSGLKMCKMKWETIKEVKEAKHVMFLLHCTFSQRAPIIV